MGKSLALNSTPWVRKLCKDLWIWRQLWDVDFLVKPCLIKRLKGKAFDDEFAYEPSIGASGGLILLWYSSFFKLERMTRNLKFLAVEGLLPLWNLSIVVINVYAPNYFNERKELFNMLSVFLSSVNRPIILGGDFNSIKAASEKFGVAPNPASCYSSQISYSIGI
ncbi:hypothetical protein F3Y22_tig00111127pilonHSYRG00023 [Hibiscus syriacus]|uniref:Endonuclease/exonuclease/phosphatase domain-containing protein n=1 Tax=Hibiscus syriacus TaxID=106335 RepID=A0A6A2YYZ9_HIBSY|nr:hypothetical protein F3Y22_tig00111127pilonHSYRG00023 [Hibiscus syriacus]